MSSLVIDRRGITITADAGALVIRTSEGGVRSVPLTGLSRLVLCHSVALDTSTLGILQALGISVVVINHRISKHSFSIPGAKSLHAERRLKQFALYFNPALRRRLAWQLVNDKLEVQAALLKARAAAAVRDRGNCAKALSIIEGLQQQQLQSPCSLAMLRGYEGSAQKAWFTAFAHWVPASLGFVGRRRRPPPDPVNCILSLAYTRIYYETITIINQSEIEPSIGFFHQAKDNRASLACDLMEPIRPEIDNVVCTLFTKQSLTARQFKRANGRLVVGQAGRLILAEELEQALLPWRKQLTERVHALAHQFDQQQPAIA